MTARALVKHGPFVGYRSSVPKHLIDAREVGSDSRDFLYAPVEGKWVERAGSVILGDTGGAGSPVGLLPSQPNLRARQVFELPNVIEKQTGAIQFADSYPTYACLFEMETEEPNPHNGAGQLYFRTTNGADSNQVPAMSWSSDTYPTTARNGDTSWLKTTPMWNQGSLMTGRPTTTAKRTFMCAGSRRVLIVGNWLYAPNYYGDPRRWNMVYNDDSAAPTRIERHFPTGLIPPLSPATIETAALPAATTSVRQWKKGERFWISLCFIFEDGSWSRPFLPSLRYGAARINSASATVAQEDNYGLVTLPAVNGTDYYPYIPWRDIPKGPNGTIGRALLRSPKVDSATGAYPRINDLRITHILMDNSTIDYDDYNGDDLALLVDDERVRFDHIWPPRARYIGAFDGRVGIGYTQPNPALILLAPSGSSAPNDITDDDNAVMGTVARLARITGSSLQLRTVTAAFPAAPVTQTISLTGLTLQGVVDAINATTCASAAGEWRACVVPGADPSTSADSLAATSGADHYGDDALVNDGTTGNMQCFSQAWPGILYQVWTVALSTYAEDKQSFWHTSNTPTSAAGGIKAAANYWLARNRRSPPEDSGIYMGMGALTDGTVLFYSKKVWLFRNTFAGRTGKDEDYRFDLLSTDGCIAWDSIVEGNGWVSWLSAKGLLATQGQPGDSVLLSGAIFDPNTATGDLAYEIGRCIIRTAADNEVLSGTDDWAAFCARKFSHEIIIQYRSSASAESPDRMHRYDFSEGAGAGGLRELLRADGTPYGWSTPMRLTGETLGFYRGASGIVKLMARGYLVQGSVGVGRIDQFDTGYQDNGTAIGTLLYTKMDDLGESRRRHRTHRFTCKYKSPTGHVLTVSHSRDRLRASATSYTLLNTGTAELGTQTKRVKLNGMAPARVSEFKFAGTRVTAAAAEIWLIEREVKLIDTPVDSAG